MSNTNNLATTQNSSNEESKTPTTPERQTQRPQLPPPVTPQWNQAKQEGRRNLAQARRANVTPKKLFDDN
jgi:hypothetical protein